MNTAGADPAPRANAVIPAVPVAARMANPPARHHPAESPAIISATHDASAAPPNTNPVSAFESSLNEGLLFERRVFHSAFALEDQKEGMAAFAEKRKPTFRNR